LARRSHFWVTPKRGVDIMPESDGNSLSDQLRDALKATGLSPRELANAAGVGLMDVIYFLQGKDLGLRIASKIAAHLRLELRPQT
jgi:hypothetical protein